VVEAVRPARNDGQKKGAIALISYFTALQGNARANAKEAL
jgi:hypothetical protein